MRSTFLALVAFLSVPVAAEAYDTGSFRLGSGVTIPYVLVLPDGYDPALKYETLIAFPGGDQTMQRAVSTVQRFWEPEAVKRGVIVVVPAAPSIGRPFYTGEGSVKLIPEIVDAIRATYPVKDGPIHLAGHSNGGVTAFRVAVRWPELFQTLTVIAGVPVEQVDFDRLDHLKGMKVSMFVGDSDVDWRPAMTETQEVMKELGIASTFTVVPRSGHSLEAMSFDKSGPLFDTVVPAR